MELNDTIITEDLLYDWNTYLARERLFDVVWKSVLLILGVLGNAAVISIYWTRMKDSRWERYFIPHLAMADFFATIATCLRSILISSRYVTFPSVALCKVLYFAAVTPSFTSVVYLVVICVLRYQRICFLNKTDLKLRYKRLIIFGVLLLISIIELPATFFFGERTVLSTYKGFNVSGITCSVVAVSPELLVLGYICNSVNIISYMAIVAACAVLYAKIGRVVYKSVAGTKQRQRANVGQLRIMGEEDTNGQPRKRAIYKAKHNFTYMLLAMISLQVITIIPVIVINVLYPIGDEWNLDGVKLNVVLMFREFYILYHVANPFLYSYFDMKFREELKSFVLKFRYACVKDDAQ